MDEATPRAADEATSNGKVTPADLPALVEDLRVSRESDSSPGEPPRAAGQRRAGQNRSGRRGAEENGVGSGESAKERRKGEARTDRSSRKEGGAVETRQESGGGPDQNGDVGSSGGSSHDAEAGGDSPQGPERGGAPPQNSESEGGSPRYPKPSDGSTQDPKTSDGSPRDQEPDNASPPDPGQDSGPLPDPDQDPGAPPDGEAGPLTLRWQLVEPGGASTPEMPPLAFSTDLIAQEASSNKRWRPQGAAKKLMESYHIYQIKKPPSHHKHAKYVCRVCELHWESLHAVQKHVNDQRHTNTARRHRELTAVNTLPDPTPAQTARLTELLSAVYSEHGLTEERLAERRRVAEELKQTLREGLRKRHDIEEFGLEVYGSSRHGCGFSDSCLDVALIPSEEGAGAALLTRAIQVLQDSDEFTEVCADFHSWSPCVRCVHAESGQRCQVALGAEREVELARLVQLYTEIDGRTAPLAVALRHLARVCEMDRPHAGSLPPSAFVLMTIYQLQQCEPPVLPALHEMVGAVAAEEEPQPELDFAAAAATASSWRSANPADLGALWLRLLRFYALELSSSDLVVTVRQRAPVTRADKGWNKRISIEDPVQSKRNISRSISSNTVADLILDRLRAACLLFGVPRTAAGPAVCLSAARGPPVEEAELAERLGRIGREEMEYGFDRQLLCGEMSMPVVCSVCQKTGHPADECPTLVVPPAEPLPPPSQQQIQLLDRICGSVFNDWAPPGEEYHHRQNMLHGIESFIRHQSFPSARLTLFGSSCNGFGFTNSDLDICMTFEDCDDPQLLDQPEIILKLSRTLNRLRSVCNVIPISTAKVPIVKFTDRRSRLEADISLYNTLAQHNTLLLHTYAKLDSRARILGYMVKLMAKICDICDASRGSLSSYAYTLLLIYYLQRCRPPVLPVLQELDAGNRPPCRVDGAEVGFFTELERLGKVWPEAGRNTCCVGELWLGFLRFYGEYFDFEKNVVCIRRMEVLTKFEKMWNSAFIAIEDPFLLSHNLGGGVRRKMASFIRRTLLRWRLHHMRPTPNTLPHGYRDFRAFLMCPDHLCEGTPPNASGCHACGKIGHWAADCPRRRRRPPPPAAAGKPPPPRAQGRSPTKGERSPTKGERSPTKRGGLERGETEGDGAERLEAEGDGPERSESELNGGDGSRTTADGPSRSPTKVDRAGRPSTESDGTDRSPTKAESQSHPETKPPKQKKRARNRAAPTAAAAAAASAAAAAAAGESTAELPAGAAAGEQGATAARKPRKRPPRRRKPDRAAPAEGGAGRQEPLRTVVFYNSNHSGGASVPDAASA